MGKISKKQKEIKKFADPKKRFSLKEAIEVLKRRRRPILMKVLILLWT